MCLRSVSSISTLKTFNHLWVCAYVVGSEPGTLGAGPTGRRYRRSRASKRPAREQGWV